MPGSVIETLLDTGSENGHLGKYFGIALEVQNGVGGVNL